ncbi:ABC transporter substrate-binding protein [Fredinandcohnia sp. 179-A 10B2 NHS]|uniref:ABC transporter substrate-binding protein n=1 Tax=Fredinandcohnia sp. 179-A 10B2 NHS TaxID=3235176 RepID=UPI0039A3F65F
MKKTLKAATFVLLSLLLVFITACSKESGGEKVSKDGEIIIRFPHMYVGTDPHAEWFNKVVEDFNNEHKGKIKVVTEEIAGEQNYVDKMKLLLQSDELPDIGMSPQGLLDIAYEAGKTVDLTPYLEENPEFKEQFDPASMEVNTFDGEVHGLPNFKGLIGYFYNKTLFEKAGIDAPAKTWDELFEQFETLKASGITPLSLDTAETGWITSLWFNAMIGSSGSEGLEFMNTYFPTDFNKPYIVDALTKVQTMLQDYTTQDAIGAKYDTAAMHFLNGETAMIANGPWMIGDFDDPAKAKEGLAEEVGVALFPEQTVFDTPEKGFYILSQDKEHQDAAFEFLKELVSPERQYEMLLLKGELPDSPKVEITDEVKEKYPVLADFLVQAKDAENRILYYQKTWYNNVTNEVSNIYPALANGQLTPEEAAKKLTEASLKNE